MLVLGQPYTTHNPANLSRFLGAQFFLEKFHLWPILRPGRTTLWSGQVKALLPATTDKIENRLRYHLQWIKLIFLPTRQDQNISELCLLLVPLLICLAGVGSGGMIYHLSYANDMCYKGSYIIYTNF